LNDIAGPLVKWFARNGRRFPWREERDPYHVLIAEIMLQRTKADQVKPVYLSFMARFPTPEALDKAMYEEVESCMSRLGLRWRIPLVKKLAKRLVSEFQGQVPRDRDKLLELPGIGEYIADAVLVFCHDVDVATVDSNVCRIFQRLTGSESSSEARRDRGLRELIESNVPPGMAREFNWALIDLGSLVCKSRNPLCSLCPLSEGCSSGQAHHF